MDRKSYDFSIDKKRAGDEKTHLLMLIGGGEGLTKKVRKETLKNQQLDTADERYYA